MMKQQKKKTLDVRGFEKRYKPFSQSFVLSFFLSRVTNNSSQEAHKDIIYTSYETFYKRMIMCRLIRVFQLDLFHFVFT